MSGAKLLVHPGDAALTANIYTGLFEFRDMSFLLHLLREDDTFVDVGANLGAYTILAAGVAGATTYAIEPIPSTYRRLVENVHLNWLDNVRCFNQGAGAASAILEFTADTDSMNHVLRPGEASAHTVRVEVRTLDATLSGQNPIALKIDVEGYETAVLAGAHATLCNPNLKAIVIELCGSADQYGFSEEGIVQTLGENGFAPHTYDPFSRTISHGRGNEHNVLFLRDTSFVSDRVKTARLYRVHGQQL